MATSSVLLSTYKCVPQGSRFPGFLFILKTFGFKNSAEGVMESFFHLEPRDQVEDKGEVPLVVWSRTRQVTWKA